MKCSVRMIAIAICAIAAAQAYAQFPGAPQQGNQLQRQHLERTLEHLSHLRQWTQS